jgi:hypothetical protein
VLFRPFHEHTGGWFWWGNKTTPDAEYKALFRYTADYLKNRKKVHNLLYVYNTGTEFANAQEYLNRYPGDDVIDILSFDTYQWGDASANRSFVEGMDMRLSIWQPKRTKLQSSVKRDTTKSLMPNGGPMTCCRELASIR